MATDVPWESFDVMQSGAPLLKYGRRGEPHFRDFVLTDDFKRLAWVSKKKDSTASQISLADRTLLTGFKTPLLQKQGRPEFKELSFSLAVRDGDGKVQQSLDLVCKDKTEFNLWVAGLRYLTTHGAPTGPRRGGSSFAESKEDRSSSRASSSAGPSMKKMEDSNDVYSWGDGSWGQLGHGSDSDVLQPEIVSSLLGQGIRKLSCGLAHTAALSDSGQLFTWGHGGHGRLGRGSTEHLERPKMVPKPGVRGEVCCFATVACGDFHTVATTADGHMFTWGCAAFGQLGHGDTVDRLVPTEVEGLRSSDVCDVTAGHMTTLAITRDGRLYSFGSNDVGLLGLGDVEDRLSPQQVTALSEKIVTSAALGDVHAAVVTEEKQVFMWGWNGVGQLGLGDTEDRLLPTLLPFFSDKAVWSVALGAAHSAAIADGLLYTWGAATSGQLGHGPAEVEFIPEPCYVQALKDVEHVACGSQLTTALVESGDVYVWGDGSAGATGSGSRTSSDRPAKVDVLGGKVIRSVSCGASHICATVATQWIDDDDQKECMLCHSVFTLFNRRHHCRNCGGLFCASCSSKRLPLLKLGMIRPVRVCDNCHLVLRA
eukprot:PLAT6603.1.p1 GENE.PLAT6603.1~~PLAT6603.1.p1  ORF type:complete len:603 (+),score=216.03 PLAT6603.1:24-1811(+)